MKVLGITGSLNLAHENSSGDMHDGAATLVIDGEVVAAIEEERLNRIKHTDKFPVNAIKFILRQQDLKLEDLDQICYYSIQNYYFQGEESVPLAEKIQEILFNEFGSHIDRKKLYFVHHHLAHAVSTFYMSGFARSLVLTIDGTGDGISGMILNGEGKKLDRLESLSNDNSLGIYYLNVIYILGYKQFDEYKVMGLAPYGNPDTYRDLFRTFYKLLPEGRYQIDLKKVKKAYLLTPRRKKDEPFTQVHKDIASALQESLEDIVMHVLGYYQKKYNHTKLCLSGGVAHNCTVNGKILYSGLFEDVFVHPASHDAGCAVGAALYRYHELNPQAPVSRLEHLYWGTGTGDNGFILNTLEYWQDFLNYEKVDNITEKTAQLLARGGVIGWVQGKSEFGPRALGNRSIIADPRPAAHKDIINAMVKKREAYRPFAPSVLEEYVEEYYEVPFENKHNKFAYMVFVVNVKEDKQKILGAVTHVDGTSRIQTVSRKTNERYWQLIDEFRKITGIPVVLNTSFNNNAEPIVDSVTDAIVCFLTTKLNYLVIGDYLIKKKEVDNLSRSRLAVTLPVHNVLTQTIRYVSPVKPTKMYEIKNNFDNGYRSTVTSETFSILSESGNGTALGELLKKKGFRDNGEENAIIDELYDLWTRRFIRLTPRGLSAK
ncbi:carbamoyltransferase [Acidobacteriota bacterium]